MPQMQLGAFDHKGIQTRHLLKYSEHIASKIYDHMKMRMVYLCRDCRYLGILDILVDSTYLYHL